LLVSSTQTTYTRVRTGESIALGRYILLRKLRVEGAVELFLGLHRSAAGVEKLVVIKRVSRMLAKDRSIAEQLLAEARLAGQLSHVNIAQVFDVGEDDGSYYFAMEHVLGKSLRSVQRALEERGARLPVEHAIHVGVQLCAALSHAHERKDLRDRRLDIVHGGISPDNVFVTFAGDVKVTDFGVFTSRNETQGARQHIGAPPIAFPAPEQARGEPPDPRTDVYAVGMLLLELTTGKAPLYRPPEFAQGYPPKLAAILLQAAARRRTHRHQSVTELLAQLETLAQRMAIRASPAGCARFLRDLFPDAEARHLRERREAKRVGLARDQPRTIPGPYRPLPPPVAPAAAFPVAAAPVAPSAHSPYPPPRPPALTPANHTLEVLPPTAGERPPEIESEGASAPASTPPAVRTWRPPVETSRYSLAAVALGVGIAIGIGASSMGRRSSASAATPAPPAQPSAASAIERGSLEVQSEPPGASIFLEGELMSEPAPATLRGLPLGRPIHLRVVRGGFEPRDVEITLTAERPRDRLMVEMTPATITLHLTIDAPDPALWVDGKFTSARTVPGLAIDQEHKIAVSSPGYIGKVLMFRSEQGGDKRLHLKLDPVRTPL